MAILLLQKYTFVHRLVESEVLNTVFVHLTNPIFRPAFVSGLVNFKVTYDLVCERGPLGSGAPHRPVQ